jgi:hypothetical protein
LRYIDCEAWGTIWQETTLFEEGHGFAADDFASNIQFVGCVSRNNEGLAFSLNRGSNNKIFGCVGYGNGLQALQANAAPNSQVNNCTFWSNNSGTRAPNNVEIRFSETGSTSCVVSNNVLIGTRSTGVEFNSTAGGTATTNAISGYTTAVLNGSASGTITTDMRPWLNSDGSLRMPGNPLATAGTYVSGVTLANGRLRPNFTPIGAYMAVLPRTARV